MEKEEKKADLEQLLNSLIKRWRVPFGIKKIEEINYVKHHWTLCWYFWWWSYQRWKPIRELVSKESWLWQFVCEMSVYNNYNKEKWKVFTWKKFEDDKYQINWYSNWWWYIQDYEYRLIESSLKDESELEQFLLSNIKVDVKRD